MDMNMFPATPSRVDVVTSVQRRRRWTPEQKLEIVKQTNAPGSSVSMVARQFGITAAQPFQWRKDYLQGSLMSVGANETVVPRLTFKKPCAASNNWRMLVAARLLRMRCSGKQWTVRDVVQIIRAHSMEVLVSGPSESDMNVAWDIRKKFVNDPDLAPRCRRVSEIFFSLEAGTAENLGLYKQILTKSEGNEVVKA